MFRPVASSKHFVKLVNVPRSVRLYSTSRNWYVPAARRQPALLSLVGVAIGTGWLLTNNTVFTEPKLDDCPDVACSSKKDALFASFGNASQKKTVHSQTNGTNGTEHSEAIECPLDREELGRATWQVLHSFAAYYPVDPTEADKAAAQGLVTALTQLYPCSHCREHFVKDVAEHPPILTNRELFAKWVCERHNTVNKWLGKKEFECSATALEVRWRTGSSKCKPDESSLSASETLGH